MLEEWKDVVGHAQYQISNQGRVWSKITNKEIVGEENNAGYLRVTLYQPTRKRFFKHRLVASHFVEGDSQDRRFVNHKDGDKTNNRADNLEWVTQSENEIHAYASGLRDRNQRVAIKYKDTEEVFEFDSHQDLAEHLNCTPSNISYFKRVGGSVKHGFDMLSV